jgi:hypothetical protein
MPCTPLTANRGHHRVQACAHHTRVHDRRHLLVVLHGHAKESFARGVQARLFAKVYYLLANTICMLMFLTTWQAAFTLETLLAWGRTQ